MHSANQSQLARTMGLCENWKSQPQRQGLGQALSKLVELGHLVQSALQALVQGLDLSDNLKPLRQGLGQALSTLVEVVHPVQSALQALVQRLDLSDNLEPSSRPKRFLHTVH